MCRVTTGHFINIKDFPGATRGQGHRGQRCPPLPALPLAPPMKQNSVLFCLAVVFAS